VTVREFLAGKLAAGPVTIGQIRVQPDGTLTHIDDVAAAGLREFTNPHDAIDLARWDDAGAYRPLKSAPNLRHGWKLILPDRDAVVLALEFFYPAALGLARSLDQGTLQSVPGRATLDRQTGMYAVTKKLTRDQGTALHDEFCRSGCLRTILWPVEPGEGGDVAAAGPQTVPLLCAECCNLFVAEARKVVKKAQAAATA
jgi:sirohydrochlorin cobaltochelatase